MESGYVPSPAEVSEREGINFLGNRGKDSWPIRIGCLNSKDQIPKWSMMAMKCVTGEDRYFICTEIFSKGFKRTKQQGILLCLHEGAEAMDIIMGLLQACYIRWTLVVSSSSGKWEYSFRKSNSSDLALKEWSAIIEQSRRLADRTSSKLIEQMLAMGWAVKSILLTTRAGSIQFCQ